MPNMTRTPKREDKVIEVGDCNLYAFPTATMIKDHFNQFGMGICYHKKGKSK